MKYLRTYLSVILSVLIWICLILQFFIPELRVFFAGLEFGLLIGEFMLLIEAILDREF